MRDAASVANGCGYVLTEQGKRALDDPEICKCDIYLVGRQLLCRHCETLYGYVTRGGVGNYWQGRPRD